MDSQIKGGQRERGRDEAKIGRGHLDTEDEWAYITCIDVAVEPFLSVHRGRAMTLHIPSFDLSILHV